MKIAPQFDLSDVVPLLEQRNYNEALPILGDLLEKHPEDRETRMYRLLAIRILVLYHSLNHPDHDSQSQSIAAELREVDKLTNKNKEQREAVDSLSGRLAASQRTIEHLQRIQHGAQTENEHLHAAKQELQQEIANLKDQFQQSETRLNDSVRQKQEASDRFAQLKTEVANLKEQAEEDRVTARDLEAVQHRLAAFQSREIIFSDQRHNMEAQISGLQRDLSAEKEKVQKLDVARKSLVGLCRVLRDENRRLKEEIARAQERIAVGEKNETQVRTPGMRKWRFGILLAIVVLAIAFGAGFVVRGSDGVKELTVQPKVVYGEHSPPNEPASDAPNSPTPAAVSTSGQAEFVNQRRASNPPSGLRGTFEITRPTPVYSGPSEISLRIGEIEPGMKINVVASRDGWLEISKHGRRRGFIRQHAVVRDQNN
jgi:regulator of replication initiation timing